MNHLACGTCGQHHTSSSGLSGLGATKKAQQAAADEELGRDIAQRLDARVGMRSLWDWQIDIGGGARLFLGAKMQKGAVHLQLNRLFATAPEGIREDITTYFAQVLTRSYGGPRDHHERIKAWTASPAAQQPVKTYQRSGITRRADGLDLQDIYAQLVATHIRGTKFETTADWTVPRLTFGKRAKPSKRIQLGLYTMADKTITIHGNMMDERWPAYVIADTMWHEMMHYYQDATGEGLSHNAIFRVRERLFSGHKMANDWLTHNNPFVFGKDPNHVVEHPHQRGAR